MEKKTGLKYENRITNILGFVLLLVLYGLAYFGLNYISRANFMISIFGAVMPAQVLTGVISSLTNICTILFVIFFKKTGFITAIVLTVVQFPVLIVKFVIQQSAQSIPGFFSTIFTLIAIFLIFSRNRKIEIYQSTEIKNLKEQQKFSERLFKQTATALVNAIDAKDTYSHGHSIRVAEYSLQIAQILGKSEDECQKIFYAALLHDVGKIGIDDSIINKPGKLTKEEFDLIKLHPVTGNQILTSISEYPYLSIGAHYHHERYDGKGYPDGLKGDDIPEIARIISVADAYDAMSSKRSYRDVIPQQLVREEIVKGAGTQFDPEIARIMLQLIDADTEYQMKERKSVKELAGKDELICGSFRDEVSDGIFITDYKTHIHLKYIPEKSDQDQKLPVMILFDSLDGRIHEDEKTIKDLNYFEYCEIGFDGQTRGSGVRNMITGINESTDGEIAVIQKRETVYEIDAVRYGDHFKAVIDDGSKKVEVTVALPDSTRYLYISLSGENCTLSDVSIEESGETITDGYIERIAEKISYIDGPEGDIPSVEIDSIRSNATPGKMINGSMTFSFHTKSLPTARLIWHCPYIVIYSSGDSKVFGENYKEYSLIRLDGEEMKIDDIAQNKLVVYNDEFIGWDGWKKNNKEGFDVKVSISREGNRIITSSDNFGLNIKNTTILPPGTDPVYAALTGDQCVLTNIRITE